MISEAESSGVSFRLPLMSSSIPAAWYCPIRSMASGTVPTKRPVTSHAVRASVGACHSNGPARPRKDKRDRSHLGSRCPLMWAANDPIGHHHCVGSGRLDERQNFFRYTGITAYVGPLGEPTSKSGSFGILRRHNADSELGGHGIVRAVARRSQPANRESLSWPSYSTACKLAQACVRPVFTQLRFRALWRFGAVSHEAHSNPHSRDREDLPVGYSGSGHHRRS